MRLLFEMDAKDYNVDGPVFIRHSARCITIDGGRAAMVHSAKYDYYKFPGGGIEKGEAKVTALMRETREEAGLMIIPASVREYGYVHRIEKSDRSDDGYFLQDNFYYLCSAEQERIPQDLDDYEAEEGFTLEWVEPDRAIFIN